MRNFVQELKLGEVCVRYQKVPFNNFQAVLAFVINADRRCLHKLIFFFFFSKVHITCMYSLKERVVKTI